MWLATLTMLSTLATLTMLATLTKIYLKEVFPFLSFQQLLCKLYSIVGGGLVFDVVKSNSNDTTTPRSGFCLSIRGRVNHLCL